MTLLGLVLTAVGLGVAAHGWNARSDARAFETAPRCARGETSGCWSLTPARVVRGYTEYRRSAPDTLHVELSVGTSRVRLQLINQDQWASLYMRQRVQLVRFDGQTIGLDVAGALYPSADYPSYSEADSFLTAAIALGWGLALLIAMAAGFTSQERGLRVPIWVPVACAAVAGPPSVALFPWIWMQSARAALWTGIVSVPVFMILIWFAQTQGRARRLPGYVPSGRRHAVVSAPAAYALIAGVLTYLGSTSSSAALNCATVSPSSRPVVGVCKTSLSAFALALVPRSGAAPIGLEPSCLDGGGLSPVGLARLLRTNNLPVTLWGPSAGSRYAWLVGDGALGYVTNARSGRVRPSGLFVIGVFPDATSAVAAYASTDHLRGLRLKLNNLNLPPEAAYRSVLDAGNLVVFQLFPSTKADEVVYEDIGSAAAVCST